MYIKTSFIFIILFSVFNIGLSKAHTEKVKIAESKTVKTAHNSISLKCTTKIPAFETILLLNINQKFYREATSNDPSCIPMTWRDGNTVYIIRSDCSFAVIEIDPTKSELSSE